MSGPQQGNTSGNPGGRRDGRYRVQIPVMLSLGDYSLELRTADVSLRGLFLRTDRVLRPGQFIRMDIVLPFTNVRLSLFGSVAFSTPPPGNTVHPPGSGIEFYGNGPQELRLWREFLLEVKQRLPESEQRDVVLVPSNTVSPDPVRRRFQRFETEIQVRGYFGEIDDLVLMYTRDVSKGGMFIRTSALLDVGSEISLQLVHPLTQFHFSVRCIVRRVVADRSERGMGVEFLDLDDHRRNQLWDFISSGVPNIPQDDYYLPEAADAALERPLPVAPLSLVPPTIPDSNKR